MGLSISQLKFEAHRENTVVSYRSLFEGNLTTVCLGHLSAVEGKVTAVVPTAVMGKPTALTG